MQSGNNLGKGMIIAGAILLLALPAWAGNGNKGASSGKGSGSQTQSRLRDGSCQDAIERPTADRLLAGDMLQDYIQLRKHLKDGSCLEEEG